VDAASPASVLECMLGFGDMLLGGWVALHDPSMQGGGKGCDYMEDSLSLPENK